MWELPRTRRVGAEPLPLQPQNLTTRTRSLRAFRDKDESTLPSPSCAKPLGFTQCLVAWNMSEEQKRSSWVQTVECTRTENTLAESSVVFVNFFNRTYTYVYHRGQASHMSWAALLDEEVAESHGEDPRLRNLGPCDRSSEHSCSNSSDSTRHTISPLTEPGS